MKRSNLLLTWLALGIVVVSALADPALAGVSLPFKGSPDPWNDPA